MNIIFNNIEGLNQLITIQVILGEAIIRQQTLPLLFAKNEFVSLCQSISKDTRPLEIKCIDTNEYSESGKQLENSLSFRNNTMLSFLKDKENESNKCV
jgi:hypothetical protein